MEPFLEVAFVSSLQVKVLELNYECGVLTANERSNIHKELDVVKKENDDLKVLFINCFLFLFLSTLFICFSEPGSGITPAVTLKKN